jgi:deferrochelatase/peroxidase EfeB
MMASPGRISRRSFLTLTAGAAAGTLAAGSGVGGAAAPSAEAYPDGATETTAERSQLASFTGPHQAAILSEPTAATAFVAFDVTAESKAELRELLQTITARMRILYRGGLPEDLGPASPPGDNGIAGPALPQRAVAFVFGTGSSLFDHRFGLASKRPARLTEMQSFPNDDLDPAQCNGDLGIQVCAGSADLVVHALRDLTKHTRGGMQPRWRIDGFKSPPRPTGTPRNLLGFKDGIANPSTADPDAMNSLVWVGSSSAEPPWTAGGTYQVVRVIRMLVEFWDRVSLNEQETMIGRRRSSGAPLDADTEFAAPDYVSDPRGMIIPRDAHIRLANPRTAATAESRILRRGYNYDRGIVLNGNLDMGLLFTCYQQDINRQFVATQTRLIDEPLTDYVSPRGGGYFFCPPGLDGRDGFLADGMF